MNDATKTLFDRPLAHTGDVATSFEAADGMIESGKLNKQEQAVWKVICDITTNHQFETYACSGAEDFTAKELSNWSGTDYYTIQRRLSGLFHKGKIERTGEKRNGCCVWRIV